MKSSSTALLSPDFTVDDWNKLALTAEEHWQTAVDTVEDRINGRFIRWIDLVIGQEFAGFAAVALDCLLLETAPKISITHRRGFQA